MDNNNSVLPYIDYSLCTGCGACVEAYPEMFELREGQAWLINHELFSIKSHDGIVDICSFGAISLIESSSGKEVKKPTLGARGSVRRGR